MIKYYPLKRKTNRWPNRFRLHIVQLLIHNSYVLYKELFVGQKLDHFNFHCKITDFFISNSLQDEKTTIAKEKRHIAIKNEK
jgi:hypothetical protein